ncbi:M13 family metallopeptidase [Pseudoalteromonas tunicata]|uniref:Peptidase, M13 family (Lipoprotein) n=1 Tax=Pseudoalteromonas tunicata D2 TaxID=87626 RepID=A4C8D9_9GAMM|nr:M13 family metallopeptidase [Pseudoalteromonas tunicata]ATC93359.1 endothelin-converting enzyme [Pseudoalteromonas tunicata]AXT32407.1 M13 family peptidase [Pseudoalteromonas tunicata]EAR28854.1 Peptidase, M13 family (lipoprotein) [Pseudoalteromonas tunicata D2]
MKKVTFLATSVALALGLTGCGEQAKTATATATATKTANTMVVNEAKAALVSGIELENIDHAVRAQDDFYQHVNGVWLRDTKIPDDKSNYGSFTQLYDNSQAALKKVIEAAAANATVKAGSDEQKLGDFYKSFMDQSTANKLGFDPLKADLANIAALTDKKGLAGLMAELRIKGSNTPFAWYVNNDEKKSSEYALYVFQSGLGLPDRDYYLKNDEKFTKIREQYQTYITQLLALAGDENAADAAKNIIALEAKLATAQWSRVENRDATKAYNKLTTAEVDTLLGDFDFAAFLAQSNLNVKELIVSQPSYLAALAGIYAETDLTVWQDYLSFHFVNTYASKLGDEFVDLNFAFYSTTLRGVEQQQPRWKTAVDSANDVLGEILGKVYVKDNFPPEAKQRMGVLVNNLIKAYGVAIDELEWMSAETKVAAKEKLNKFTPKIGYPDKWKDYSALEIKAGDLVGNFIRHSQWAYADMSGKLGKPVDRSEWFMTPQTVNAYYNPVNNEIVFPAAILQPPFFNLAADDAVNYGAIGAVIGHELGHGFDDQGAKYDGDGNLRDWWNETDLAQFQERGAKLIAQYDGFKPFDDAHVNGSLTLGENIGDLGGLTVAYKAYQMSLSGNKAPEIDGFTGEQRFFMGWAQVWRRNYRDEELRNRLMTDPHSPSQYRVIGILSNMPEFYQAFAVKAEDKMYVAPEQRVKIW